MTSRDEITTRTVADIEAAAEHIARADTLSRPVGDSVARVLRALAHEIGHGRMLAVKVTDAVQRLTTTVRAETGYQDGDDLTHP